MGTDPACYTFRRGFTALLPLGARGINPFLGRSFQYERSMNPNRTSVLLDNNLLGELKRLAKRQRTTATRLLEQAAREFLDRQASSRWQAPGGPAESTEQDVTQRVQNITRRRLHRPSGW